MKLVIIPRHADDKVQLRTGFDFREKPVKPIDPDSARLNDILSGQRDEKGRPMTYWGGM